LVASFSYYERHRPVSVGDGLIPSVAGDAVCVLTRSKAGWTSASALSEAGKHLFVRSVVEQGARPMTPRSGLGASKLLPV